MISLENLVLVSYKAKPILIWLLEFSYTLGSFSIFKWSSQWPFVLFPFFLFNDMIGFYHHSDCGLTTLNQEVHLFGFDR